MVGTPTSLGCQTCRTRKKKCTGERPACSQCRKAGWRCPGYIKRWIFVDASSRCNGWDKGGWQQATVKSSELGELLMYEAERTVQASFYVGIILQSLSSEAEKNSLMLASILDNGRAQALLPLHALGSFFPLIPARLGRNSALDTAITCLCSIYHRFLSGGESAVASEATLNNYVKCLAALQNCVSDPGLRYQSETLCASILVQLCELMTSKNTGRWSNLLKGSGLLFKESDPERFTSGFDRTLLESQRAMLIVQDMHAGEDCFLAEPQWRHVLHSSFGPRTLGHRPGAIELRNTLCDVLVDFPGMAREEAELLASSTTPCKVSRGLRRLESAIHQVSLLRSRMGSWYDDFAQAVPYDAKRDPAFIDGTVPFDMDRTGDADRSSPLYAILDCVATAVSARLDKMLLRLNRLQPGISASGCLAASFLAGVDARRQKARATFEVVKSKSYVSAKPLQFGLLQIGLEEWHV